MEVFGMIFCGLGLFTIGFRMISQNLRKMTSQSYRRLIRRATQIRFLSAAVGFMSGAISQSAMASAFITAGFHASGIIPFRRSITIINWANIGTAILPFIVVLNLKLLVYYFIGLIGLTFFLQLDKTIRVQAILHFLVGLALLFLGIIMIKSAAGNVESMPWFSETLQHSAGSSVWLFLTGVLLTMVAQSGPTVSVAALSLASAGLLSVVQTVVVVLGTGIGSAINIFALSYKMKGSVKQLCLYQCIFKVVGAVVAGILLQMDFMPDGRIPGSHILTHLTAHPGQQVALVFLVMQLLPALLLSFVSKPVSDILQRLSPVTAEDRMVQTEFINELSLDDPGLALDLASKEQLRLLHLLPEYLIPVSPDRNTAPWHDRTAIHNGFIQLHQEITHFLGRLSKRQAAAGFHERVMNVQHFSALLLELESNIEEFVTLVRSSPGTLMEQPLTVRIIESLRAILDTSIETFDNPDKASLEIMLSITAEKGDMLQRIRQDFFRKNAGMDASQRQSLYTMTILFDRLCWLLRKMSLISIKSLPAS